MSQVLIVDNSRWFTTVVSQRIESDLNLEVQTAHSYTEAIELVEQKQNQFFLSLVGLYMQDAPVGAIVEYMLSKKIPTIVFTGKFNDDVRDYLLSKKVIDYVLKEDVNSLDYIVSLVRRIIRNKTIKVLVVDDSTFVREHICNLLKVHQYIVLQAPNGQKACKILEENPDIQLVITDYHMPDMDGFKLTKKIRRKFSREEMAIIGISAQGCNKLSARFIKNGANDFMIKPFLAEEFYCRITQNIEMIEYVKAIKEAMNKDPLTGLYNRRYLFEKGVQLHENSLKNNHRFLTAMLDIDYFKNVNDTYGHEAGDLVLKNVSRILQDHFPKSSIVSRFGGEEFCILISDDIPPEQIRDSFEMLRKNIENSEVSLEDNNIKITVSIGLCLNTTDSLEKMINVADSMLYKAKTGGRNRIVTSKE